MKRRIALVFFALLILAASVMASSLTSTSTQSKTITITTDPRISLDYTNKTNLIFLNNEFVLNNTYRIKPFVYIGGRELNLSPSITEFSTSITDKLAYHKWGLAITQPTTANKITSAGFYISGCSKYSENSLKCGNIELDFSDLLLIGYEFKLTDDKIIISGIPNTNFNLDPTDQLLPDANNKAYKNTTSNTVASWIANTEFTSTNYNNANTSNDVRYSQVVSGAKLVMKSNWYIFNFNLTAKGISAGSVSQIDFYHEGYYAALYSAGDSSLYYYNVTSSSWVQWNFIQQSTETIQTKTITTNVADLIDANGIVKLGIMQSAGGSGFAEIYTTYTDLAYINVTYTPVTFNGFFNVTWNYPANNTWNATTQNIVQGYTPLWYGSAISNCSLWSNISGAFALKGSNSTPLINNSINTITYNYNQDTALAYSYINCTNSSGTSNFTANYTIKIDTTAPAYSLNSTNSTLAGTQVSHNLYWQDATSGLSGFIFQFCNGTWNGSSCGHDVCYQETANASTSCGGLSTGSYSCQGSWAAAHPCANTYDGDWTIWGGADAGNTASLYVNYTKPANALNNSLWQVRFNPNSIPSDLGYGWINYTIPSDCWSQSPLQFWINSTQPNPLNYQAYAYCWNGSDWNQFPRGGNTNQLTEEAMWWDIDWKNETWQSMTGVANWSNYTEHVNSTVGAWIAWCVYTNDSAGNWNSTSCSNPFNYHTTTILNPHHHFPIPMSDPLYCSIPPFIPSVQSVAILCMPTDNVTGQPMTGLTVTCAAYSSPYFAATLQAASSATEQGNGLYNWTFLSGNQAANTCYIINCSTTVNTMINQFAGTVCVMQNNLATSTDVTNIINNITQAQNYIIGNITSANSSLAALLATLQAEVISVNTTQNSNYATLQVEVLNTNTTQNANYAAMTILLNQLGINITSTNATQNTNANNIIALLNAIGLNVTSVNATMLGNFSTLYTMTISVNTTANANFATVFSDLQQMNGTLNGLTADLGDMNTTIVATKAKLDDTYTLLSELSSNATEHNATLAAYYGNLLTALQGMNTTLNGAAINITAANSSIMLLLQGVADNQTLMNASMASNFVTTIADIQQLNTTINDIDSRVATLGIDLIDMNATLVATQGKIDDTYNLVVAMDSNLTEHNATLASYYNNLKLSLQNMNSTLNGVAVNLSIDNSTLTSLVLAVGANVSSLDSNMISNFNGVVLDLQDINGTILGIGSTVDGIAVNLTSMNSSVMAELLVIEGKVNTINNNILAVNSTILSYYLDVQAGLQSLNSSILSMNSTMVNNFTTLSLKLDNISTQLNNLNFSSLNVSVNLTGIQTELDQVNASVNIIEAQLQDVNSTLQLLNGNLTYTKNLLLTSESETFWIHVTESPAILATRTYSIWLNAYDYRGVLANLSTIPRITIYDPDRNIVVNDQPFSYSVDGLYNFSWTTDSYSTAGNYESVITANHSGEIVNQSVFWALAASPADVVINYMASVYVPTISARVTITNMGTQSSDFEYLYCLKDVNGQVNYTCQSGTHFIAAGDSWTTLLSLNTQVMGQYLFTLKAKALSEAYWAEASYMFSATVPPNQGGPGITGNYQPSQNATGANATAAPAVAAATEYPSPMWLGGGILALLLGAVFINQGDRKQQLLQITRNILRIPFIIMAVFALAVISLTCTALGGLELLGIFIQWYIWLLVFLACMGLMKWIGQPKREELKEAAPRGKQAGLNKG